MPGCVSAILYPWTVLLTVNQCKIFGVLCRMENKWKPWAHVLFICPNSLISVWCKIMKTVLYKYHIILLILSTQSICKSDGYLILVEITNDGFSIHVPQCRCCCGRSIMNMDNPLFVWHLMSINQVFGLSSEIHCTVIANSCPWTERLGPVK